jgi:hypothetical protein
MTQNLILSATKGVIMDAKQEEREKVFNIILQDYLKELHALKTLSQSGLTIIDGNLVEELGHKLMDEIEQRTNEALGGVK